MKHNLNVLNEEGKKKYQSLMFKENGYRLLLNYVKNLIKLIDQKKKADYPFRLGIVFGVPMFKFISKVNSKADLEGRIKILMQLLGIEKITVKKGSGGVLVFGFKEEKSEGN